MALRQFGAAAAVTVALALATPAYAETEIQWWHAMTGGNNDIVNKLAEDFNASQSKVHVEVRSLFVHPKRWRRGVGTELMEQALEELAALGFDEATLWSFDLNDRANAFYERHGFRRDGAGQRRDFSAGALEVRYRRALGR